MLKIILSLLPAVFASKAYSNVPYDIRWKSIKTPNFQIIFDSNHERLAQDVANKSERAKKALEQIFTEFPKNTVVVIEDYDDRANGSARNVPYPIIKINPVLPTPLTTIYNYDDWLFSLMLHEYAHTVSIYQQRGFWKLFGTIFGVKALPISLMPRWYLEGMAVDLESSYSTSSGRLNDTRLYANARAMLLDNKWGMDDIYTINDIRIPTWPLGHRPYLYGGMVINQAKQDSSLGLINKNHSGWILELYTSIKSSYKDYLDKAYQQVGLVATEQIKTIQSQNNSKSQDASSSQYTGKTETLFSKDGIIHYSPEISGDGKHMLFVRKTDNTHSQIILVQRDENQSFINGEQKKLLDARSINKVSWINNVAFVYDATEIYKNHYNYSDLFVANINGSKKRLTKGARLSFATPFNKDKLLAVQTDADVNSIVTIELKTGEITTLYKAEPGVRLSYPTTFSEGEILFNEKKSGLDLIKAFDLSSNVVTHLKGAEEKALFLSKVKDGFFYSSQVSGVSNLYFWSYKKRNSWPITNSTTEVLNGTWDEKAQETIYSELKSDGYHLVGQKSSLKAVETPKITVPYVKTNLKEEQLPPNETYRVTDYNHFQHMIPRYWYPASLELNDSYFSLLARTSAEDPTGNQRFGIIGGVHMHRPTNDFYPVGSIGYVNYMLPVRTSLSLSSDVLPGTNVGTKLERKNVMSLGISKNLTHGNELIAGFGISYEHKDKTGNLIPLVGVGYNNTETRRKNGYIVRVGGGAGINQSYNLSTPEISNITALDTVFYLPIFDNGHEIKLGSAHTYVATTTKSGRVAGDERIADEQVSCMPSSSFNWPSSTYSIHLIRGYDCGIFSGLYLHSLNLEYQMPLLKINKNLISLPIFLRNLYLRFVADNLFIVDGAMPNAFANEKKKETSESEEEGVVKTSKYAIVNKALFRSVGLEANLSFTAFYHLPSTIKIGYYQGLVAINGKHQSSFGLSLNVAGF